MNRVQRIMAGTRCRISRAYLLLMTIVCAGTSGYASSDDRPNVVIFLADDAGWGDYSHSGNTQVSTPHIDSIARDGVSFERFYVCPLCAPTRAEFLTGRYHTRGGVRGVSTGYERLSPEESTLADAYRAAGYATGAFGKWHNGSQWPYHPMARGFDEYFGHSSGHWGEYIDAPLEDNGRMVRTKGYIVDVCTDRALNFIDRNADRPFLCYVPFTTPHSPWRAVDEDWARFRDKPISLRGTVPQKEQIDETRCALAMMENQDRNVGRVLQKLDDLKLRDRTIVLYFSDNGPNTARWTGGLKGQKGTLDEGGIRSVCFMSWPSRLPQGRTIPQVAGAIDLLPTLLSLSGVARVGELPLDGKDLSALVLNEDASWSDRVFLTTWAGKATSRTERFRLDPSGKLYDMQDDPGQTKAVNDRFPDEAARLQNAIDEFRKDAVDAAPVGAGRNASVDPRPFPVGYPEFPITMLPARDGEPSGMIQRSSAAPNCSYFVNWNSLDDRMTWSLDVVTSGVYEVSLDYTCQPDDVGAEIEIAFGENRVMGTVAPEWNPALFDNQDTLPRPHGESQMKEFRTLSIGRLKMDRGSGSLTLRATRIPGDGVADVRRLTLTLVEDGTGQKIQTDDSRKPLP